MATYTTNDMHDSPHYALHAAYNGLTLAYTANGCMQCIMIRVSGSETKSGIIAFKNNMPIVSTPNKSY